MEECIDEALGLSEAGQEFYRLIQDDYLRRQAELEKLPPPEKGPKLAALWAAYRSRFNLKGVVPGIKAAGWTLTSQLEHKAEFSQGAFRLAIGGDTLTLRGSCPLSCLAMLTQSNRCLLEAC